MDMHVLELLAIYVLPAYMYYLWYKELIYSCSECFMNVIATFSTDESATEAILKSEQAYASMCGGLELNTPRDAFITALCKASLPPHYTLTILQTQNNAQQHKGTILHTLSY